MTRLLTTLTALSVAMLSLGCVRTSHQLSEVAETVTDDEILGVWEEQDPIFGPQVSDRFVIQRLKDGRYRNKQLDPSHESTGVFRLVEVGDLTYLERDLTEGLVLELDTPSKEATQASANPPVHLFPWRWERRGEWVAVWEPDQTVVNRLLRDGKLAGRAEEGWLSNTEVTSTAAEIAACLEQHSDEIYGINDAPTRRRRIYRRITTQIPTDLSEHTITP